MENVYIRIVPLKDKKSKKTNEIPLYLRIRNKEGKREFNLNIGISDQQNDLWDPFLDNVRENYSDLFNKINEINQKIGFVKDEIKLFRFPNDLERIKSYFIQTNQITIQRWKDFYYSIYNDKVLHNSKLSIGTKKNYKKSITRMDAFLSEQNLDNIYIGEINYSFCETFAEFLLQGSLDGKYESLRENSALDFIKKFRTITSIACNSGLMTFNSFKLIRLSSIARKRHPLSSLEIRSIMRLENPSLEIYKDLFLFSVYTGLAYGDAQQLEIKDIITNDFGNRFLHIKRIKTRVETYQAIPNKALEIIQKYESDSSAVITGKLLPQRSNQKFNNGLKKIGELLSISKEISTHIARHTFRSILEDAEIQDMKIVKLLMGHTLYGDIDGTYNHTKKQNKFLEAKQKIDLFLNELLNEEESQTETSSIEFWIQSTTKL